MITIAWGVTGLAVLLLAITSWRRSTRNTQSVMRAALAILASAALSVALAGSLLAGGLLLVDVLLVAATWYLAHTRRMQTRLGIVWIGILVIVLVVAKLPTQSTLGPATWIGISYLIFRLIHVAIDARRDRLGGETLGDTLVYALHPATLVAGPIDRVQHNVSEQHCDITDPAPYVNDGLWRLFIGLFKKAVLANLCYVFIAQHDMAHQPDQPIGIAWLWLVAYAFYLYFDFAAYSDLALGIGRLMGIRLPENFANPYLQPTIGRFWQTWHITLSNWLRDYIFFPMSRSLLKRYGSSRSTPILLASHLTTMVVCGLWHGLGSGFIAWGVWHGLGLFGLSQVPALRRRFNLPILPTALSIVLTFCFVTLGWVFFSTDLPTALRIFGRLFGIS
ncbi:MAG: MBOAT family O-acyltransferase [Chloroflexota bacterium]